ncbi:uncharacterized protein [Hetaerina americana]|uniref:uncharacterized protein n=1 Tax=Hetaerina americana TaxID=62018 RepID=UPI003A7F6170
MDSTFKYVMCRLCLRESASLIDIFEESYEQGFVISEVIEDLLHFKVMKLRGLPWLVCTRCLEKLKEFRLFKLQCIDSKVAFESRFLVDGKHAINDQVEIRRVRKEDVEPDLDKVSYPQVEVSRVKVENGEAELDQEFYPQVILETVDEADVEDGENAMNPVLPKELCHDRYVPWKASFGDFSRKRSSGHRTDCISSMNGLETGSSHGCLERNPLLRGKKRKSQLGGHQDCIDRWGSVGLTWCYLKPGTCRLVAHCGKHPKAPAWCKHFPHRF